MSKSWLIYCLLITLVLGIIYRANTHWNRIRIIPQSMFAQESPIPH